MGAVAKKKNAELSTDVMDDILEFAGEGATYDSSEMQIPFIRILQAMSPQLKKREAQYIEGSEQGDMFNNVTMELFTGRRRDNSRSLFPDYQVPRVHTSGARRWFSRGDPSHRSGASKNHSQWGQRDSA
jgi:hypothetical protein